MFSSSYPLSHSDLDRAFAEEEFTLVFQPKLSLTDGQTLGIECFVRWKHPDLGVLMPGEFLGFVSHHDMMRALTSFVLDRAAATLAKWREEGREWTVSINVSACDLDDPAFPHKATRALTHHKLPANALVFEASEGVLADAPEKRLIMLRSLRQQGCGVALDTNGIRLLAPDLLEADTFSELKMGGTSLIKFARSVLRAGKGIVADRLNRAREHGIATTAICIEEVETLRPLADMGFDAAQGTFFRHPDTAEGLANWSSDWLMPVLMNERPGRADTLARARARLSDDDGVAVPETRERIREMQNRTVPPEPPIKPAFQIDLSSLPNEPKLP